MSEGDEIAGLRAALAASQATVAALTRRVEVLDGSATDELGAMARAMAGMQRELTRRVEGLEQAEATYQALYESSPSPLFTVDADGVVLGCNRTALEWLALPRAELEGHRLRDLFDPDSAAVIDALPQAGWGGLSEQTLSLVDGRRVALGAVPVPGTDRVHFTLHDVTKRQVLDEAMDRRRRLEALSELAGAVARELTDPMSIVQGRLELLLDLGISDPDKITRHLSVALEHARRISATLHNLRLVGRATRTRLERVPIAEVVAGAVDLVGRRAKEAMLRVEIVPAELAAGGDLALLVRVVANLLRRTLDSSRRGEVHLYAHRRQGRVLVRISSLGITTMIAHEAGELSIVRTLLTSVGGAVTVQRSPSGTVFSLDLASPPSRRARARPVEAHVVVVGSTELGDTLANMLPREGFSLHHVASAEEALAHMEGVDGVITELVLPGMSGLSLADRLADHVRVVVVCEAGLETAPHVIRVAPPLDRVRLLEALGRRVRRRG